MAILWKAFETSCSDREFTEAVDDLIGNRERPPMLKDLSKAVDEARARLLQLRVASQSVKGGFIDQLEQAANKNRTANPDFVKSCIQLLKDRYPEKGMAVKLTKEQFFEGCKFLSEVCTHLK